MPHDSLGDFLTVLHDRGEIVRIAAPVDSALEIAEITRRISRQRGGGPTLFFESVRGSGLPVVTNILGSRSRLCRALGVNSLDELAARGNQTSENQTAGWFDVLKQSLLGAPVPSLAPRGVKTAYCQQIVKLGRDVNLWELPIPRSWPEEPHPVITLGMVVTRAPQSHERSVHLVPLAALDPQRLAVCWHRHHAGAKHWQAAKSQNQQLPVAVVLGGAPALPLIGLAPLPTDADPYHFGGMLHGKPLEVVKCRTNDLEVPAHAEIIIEGMIDPAVPPQPATPLALPNGFYASRADDWPVLQVAAVTHRANPVFPAQIFAPPPSEDTWLRLALERMFLPWIKATAPEIIDYHFPACGGGRNWLFISIRKDYPRQAHKVMHALWGHPFTMFAKGIVVVDDNVDVRTHDAVWFAAGAHADPATDLVLAPGPIDFDDLAGPTAGVGHKFGIDATRKWPDERASRPAAKPLDMPESLRRQVTSRWSEFGLPPIEEPTP
jgi:4-hydroxy-3-polyprenylbenzoate decarboxylase